MRPGVLFVHAGWFQHFMRLALGASSTPQRATPGAARVPAGSVRGRDGRIKATGPHGDRELILTLLSRPAGLGGSTGAR